MDREIDVIAERAKACIAAGDFAGAKVCVNELEQMKAVQEAELARIDAEIKEETRLLMGLLRPRARTHSAAPKPPSRRSSIHRAARHR